MSTDVEKLIKAKIPCPETGIEVRHTMCDICTPGIQCGVDAYVKDRKIIKLEGTKGFPINDGKLCTKGASGRQYLYRKNRIQYPMKRVGPRGSDEFERISWEEALNTISEKLSEQRKIDPDGTVFVTGYSKWYRPFLQRFAYSYGTKNYLTESSTCHQAEEISYKTVFGQAMSPNLKNASTVILWGINPLVNTYTMGLGLYDIKENGGKFAVIETRNTPTVMQLGDLKIRLKAGTDGILAHAIGKWIIDNNRQNQPFIDKYVYGFEEYKKLVQPFTIEKASKLTGVSEDDIIQLANMIVGDPNSVIVPGNALTHRTNGFNTHRAVISLMVILGKVATNPGTVPADNSFCESSGGFESQELEFWNNVFPENAKECVGEKRFPLWSKLVNQGQAMQLIHHMEDGEPYPIKMAALFGVNHMMYPESQRLLKAIDNLEFSFATDIVWTDVCRHSDIVLPVCTSYERSEVKCYGGRFVNYTEPAIEPLYESRPDTEIIFELARRLNLGDELLNGGYEACIKYIFEKSGITDWNLVKKSPLPVAIPNIKLEVPYLENINTPSGKIELYSTLIESLESDLNPLPDIDMYESHNDYPMLLLTGPRQPYTIHSRGHSVPWLHSFRPEISADISKADAEKYDLKQDDDILLETKVSSIKVKVNITAQALDGEIVMIQGYRTANVNDLIDIDDLDPYTGFPAYKQVYCRIVKCGKERD